MQVGNKWVSSLAVRLPAAGVELLQLREGDSIYILVDGSRELAVRKQEGIEGMMRRFEKFRGRLPADFHFSREEANGHLGHSRF